MNLLPFDIEKVKAGAKFCYQDETIPIDYEITKYGIVVQWPWSMRPVLVYPKDYEFLRLIPEEREVWINVWRDKEGDGIFCLSFLRKELAEEDVRDAQNYIHLETIHKTYTI